MQLFATRLDYRTAWDEAHRIDPPVPLNIDIELASICNLACPFCFYGEADWNKSMQQPAADGKPKKRFMPTTMALKIIDEAAAMGVPALKFNWRGESTLHPDYAVILEYAAAARAARCTCCQFGAHNGKSLPAFHDMLVNTNANCKDAAIDGLMCATKVMVSLDSWRPLTYKRMRVNGDLERAKQVIMELIRRGHPNLWVRRVVTQENQHEDFLDDAKTNLGELFHRPNIHFSQHACFDRNADEHHQVNDPKFERTYCAYPSQRMMIASDGTVFPCCVDYDGTMPMGKYPEQSLAQIWGDKPFKTLRSELRKNFFGSDACAKCTSWMAYKAPERELVQDRELQK